MSFKISLFLIVFQFVNFSHASGMNNILNESQIAAFENFFANSYLKNESSCLSDESDMQWRIQLYNTLDVSEFARCFEDGKFIHRVGCSSLRLIGVLKTNSTYICNVKNQSSSQTQATKAITTPALSQSNVVRVQNSNNTAAQTQPAAPIVPTKISTSSYVDLPQPAAAPTVNRAASTPPLPPAASAPAVAPAATASPPPFCSGPSSCDGAPRKLTYSWGIPERDAIIRVRNRLSLLDPEDDTTSALGTGGWWDIPRPCNLENDGKMLAVDLGPKYGVRKMICAPDFIDADKPEQIEKYIDGLEKANIDTLEKVTANIAPRYKWVTFREVDVEACKKAYPGGVVISSGGTLCTSENVGQTINPSVFEFCGVLKCVRIEGRPITDK